MFIRQRNFLRQVMYKYKCTNTNINIIEIHVPGNITKRITYSRKW